MDKDDLGPAILFYGGAGVIAGTFIAAGFISHTVSGFLAIGVVAFIVGMALRSPI